MWDSIFTNIFGDSETSTSPDAKGDYYFVTDAQNDFNYKEAKLCDALIALSSDTDNEYQILYGGEVTDGGSGTVNISECVAISVDADGNKRIVHLPAQTALTLPTGYDDGNKIWAILKYDFKLGSSTRSHKSGTSYHYTLQDTFYGDPTGNEGEDTSMLFTQTDPTGTAVILGTFTMTAADVFSLLSDRSPAILEKGAIPTIGNSTIGKSFSWNKLQKLLQESIDSGSLFTNRVVSTYGLAYTTSAGAYAGGVLASNGEIYMSPSSAIVGMKIDNAGITSTYSLIYTAPNAYRGGVLAINGDIHFIPHCAAVGQRISSAGVVSTYSLVYTTSVGAYAGGVLASNGEIHMIPGSTPVGQKISSAGVVSTYSLVYTTSGTACYGGVLASNGDIHMIPCTAAVGQKISASGVVSTYSLVYTTSGGAYGAYYGGVLSSNGDIHMIPGSASVGQKISSSGVVSTYSLIYTTSQCAYRGGVLAPNGDIHMIPFHASVGQKISSSGVVSTYSLMYTTSGGAYTGAIINEKGDIHFIPTGAHVGQKFSVPTGKPWSFGICLLPHFNKF